MARITPTALCAALVGALTLPAQGAESVNGGANLQRFTPAVDPLGAFSVGSGEVLDPHGWAVGLHLNYARNPLVLREGGVRAGSTLSDVAALQLHGAINLASFLELGFGLPVVAWQRGGDGRLANLPAQAIGDLELQPRIRLLTQSKSGVGLSFTPGITVPLGGGKALEGDASFSITPRVSVSHVFARSFVAADVWFHYRNEIQVLPGATLGHELGVRAAGGVDVGERTELVLEADGGVALSTRGQGIDGNPLELVGGVRHFVSDQWAIELGAGAGILSAPGTPDFRVIGGFTYGRHLRRGPPPACMRLGPQGLQSVPGSGNDTDGDGLDDACDLCPAQAEQLNGVDDQDGCPEPDGDNDGVIDAKDECPAQAGKAPTGCPDADDDGILDRADECPAQAGKAPTGCPDTDGDGVLDRADECVDVPGKAPTGCPDTDGDGVLDRADKCPAVAEDLDGFEDADGCPDPDNDQDGILDAADKCPLQAEDKDGFEDADGCPDPDNDHDGVPDTADKCPNEKETINGFEDEDGCPDSKGKSLVVVTHTKLEILDKIFFATDKDVIEKRSFGLLDQVALQIKAHDEISHIRVEGHTDDVGGHAHNAELSQRRAEAVKRYLVGKGVDAARLEAKGFADDRPLAPNSSEQSRATNRRVEFNIVDDAPPVPPELPAK